MLSSTLLAFEVFDDVAFFIFLTSLLSVVLFPYTAYFLWSVRAERLRTVRRTKTVLHKHGNAECKCAQCAAKLAALTREKSWAEHMTLHNIVLAIGWTILVIMFVQLPNYKHQEMKTFNPYEILEIETGADTAEVKKAYRKMSKKWHPDMHIDNPEKANEMFIMVSKAHQTLTNDKTRENWEKYGNPDGFQGNSVSIGLPSFLTEEDNQLSILLVYFLVMIVFPPIAVWLWWSRRKSFHEAGVRQQTMELYFKFITDTANIKNLVEVLCGSVEYRVIGGLNPEHQKEWSRLRIDTKSCRLEKERLQLPYILKGSTLLTAYLLRLDIPDCFRDDLNIILKDAHRLTESMLVMAKSKNFHRAAMAVVELKQLITQAMWQHQSSLFQLPHMTDKTVALARRKNLDSITAWRNGAADVKTKMTTELSTVQQKDMAVIETLIPEIDMKVKYDVKGEEGVYEDDLVVIEVYLTRVDPAAKAAEAEAAAAAAAIPSESTAVTGGNDVVKGEVVATGNADDFADDLDWDDVQEKVSDDEILMAHAPFFPFPKEERWVVMLLDDNHQGAILGIQRVEQLPMGKTQRVDIRLRAPPASSHPFTIVAKSDSYVGVDASSSFKLLSLKKTAEITEREERGVIDDDDDEDWSDDEEEEYDPKWYYLYHDSFLELVLTAFVLGVMCFLGYTFLQTRGYWDKYFVPAIDMAQRVIAPVWGPLSKVVLPPLLWLYQFIEPVVNYIGAWLAMEDADRYAKMAKQEL